MSGATPPLPAHVHIKTKTESFTDRFYFALRSGEIWLKDRQAIGQPGAWRRLKEPCPGKVEEISADGTTLVALTEDRLAHYRELPEGRFKTLWGHLVFGPARQPLRIPEEALWAATRRETPAADLDGTVFHASFGCSNLYVVSADRTKIGYADEWLPPTPRLPGIGGSPVRGQFVIENLSASASTMFVIDESGEMYTRFADCDSIGDNCLLRYTHERGFRPGKHYGLTPRALPAEDWTLEPRIPHVDGRSPARISRNITVLQQNPTGANPNHARELRVQGIDGAKRGGYYRKDLTGDTWSFVATGETIEGPFLDTTLQSRRAPSRERHFRGSVTIDGAAAAIRILGFLTHCSGTRQIVIDGEPVPLTLHSFRYVRPDRSKPAELWGAFVADEIPASTSPRVRSFLRALMEGQRARDVHLTLGDQLVLRARKRSKRGEVLMTLDRDSARG